MYFGTTYWTRNRGNLKWFPVVLVNIQKNVYGCRREEDTKGNDYMIFIDKSQIAYTKQEMIDHGLSIHLI